MPDHDSFADTTEHPLGPTVTVRKCWAVYKDYDANSPDAPDCVCCATNELALQVAKILNDLDEHGPKAGPDAEFAKEFGWDFCDGWEWCSGYTTHETIAEEKLVARSLAQARDFLLGRWGTK